MDALPILGKILSHGFMMCGFLPVKVTFPVLAVFFCGLDVSIPDNIMIESFVDYVSTYERSVLKDALIFSEPSFPRSFENNLVEILSRYGCNSIPTPASLNQLILAIARHELFSKPFSVLFKVHSGIPIEYLQFFHTLSLQQWYTLYKDLNATPSSVLHATKEPDGMNAAESRVFQYLKQFISNSSQEHLRNFLRFVTGSSVLSNSIIVQFNNTTGLGRCPIAHTCGCSLELPISYSSYPEFDNEFSKILTNEFSWFMDTI